MTRLEKIIKFDVINSNNRMYTKESMKQSIKNYNKQLKLTGVKFGELGYPDNSDNFEITGKNISHRTGKLFIKKDILYSEITVLDTSKGKLLQGLIDTVVFRPRMIGEIDDNNLCTVKQIVSIDAINKMDDSYLNII